MKKIALFLMVVIILLVALSLVLYQKASKIKGYTFLCMDDKGRVYSVLGSKIYVFSSEGGLLFEFKGKETSNFCSIDVDLEGNIYVADRNIHKIRKLSSEGDEIFSFGEFKEWFQIEVEGEKIFVADTTSHQIQVFDLEGKLLSTYGKKGEEKGEFKYPNDISHDNQGNFYVADTNNHRIQIFNPQFKYIGGFSIDHGKSFGWPTKIEVDEEGNIYVVNSDEYLKEGRVYKFSPKGKILDKFERPHMNFSPVDIALDKRKRIVLTDEERSGLELFAATGTHLGKWGNKSLKDRWQKIDRKKRLFLLGRFLAITILILLIVPIAIALYLKERGEKYKKMGIKIDEARLPKLSKRSKIILTVFAILLVLWPVCTIAIIEYLPEVEKLIPCQTMINLVLLSMPCLLVLLIVLPRLLGRKWEWFLQGEKHLLFKEKFEPKLGSVLEPDEKVLSFSRYASRMYLLTDRRILITRRNIWGRLTDEIDQIDYSFISRVELKRGFRHPTPFLKLYSIEQEKTEIKFISKIDVEDFYGIIKEKANVQG